MELPQNLGFEVSVKVLLDQVLFEVEVELLLVLYFQGVLQLLFLRVLHIMVQLVYLKTPLGKVKCYLVFEDIDLALLLENFVDELLLVFLLEGVVEDVPLHLLELFH